MTYPSVGEEYPQIAPIAQKPARKGACAPRKNPPGPSAFIAWCCRLN